MKFALHKNKTLPEFVILNKLGKEIKGSVRQSDKAKRISIKIKNHQPELVISNTNFKQAYIFLLSKESWVRKKLSAKKKTYYRPQYCSKSHHTILKDHGIVQSMSRKGDCWDNATSESFLTLLKEH